VAVVALLGCAPTVPDPEPTAASEPVPNPEPEAEPVRPLPVTIQTTETGDTVTIHIPLDAEIDENLLSSALGEAASRLDYATLLNRTKNDSIVFEISAHFSHEERSPFRPVNLAAEKGSLVLKFALDRGRIAAFAELLGRPPVIVSPTLVPSVTPHEEIVDSFDYLPDGLLLEPCAGVSYPTSSILLPNAPRAHRSGTHRGIDFQSPYGTPIRAAEGGVVIRADHGYEEITNDFRKSLLKKAATIGRTPSDVFEHILFGQTIFIDHGVDIVKGKRLVTIYAHMSEIAEDVTVGASVKRGQRIGKVGASGTSDGALGNWDHAHLHFELIIQDKTGERYMGQGLRYGPLTKLLKRLFLSR
tara:strand:- start:1576 stop:2649 length:1074 start_codon:yes stop_codon:yes gene_type:complete